MEVPRLRVESELQQPASTIATTPPDLSHICDLHHSSRQHWILNPMRMWVQSLASLIGLGSGIAMSYGVGHRCGLDLVLLWLWCRPAATALI